MIAPTASAKPFIRKRNLDVKAVLGARWWQAGLANAPDLPTRRSAMRAILGITAGIGGIGVIAAVFASLSGSRRDAGRGTIRLADGRDVPIPPEFFDPRPSLDAQKTFGWNVGAPDAIASSPHEVLVDALGEPYSPTALDDLVDALRPGPQRLRPYYVPTLFQSVAPGVNPSLRATIKPVRTTTMPDAFDRGEAVRTLFAAQPATRDTALVIDLPGPESVAFAAAVAPLFAPVFGFDNWPHPQGVVPAHATLGAALHHLPDFRAAARDEHAPPAFVLDRERLNRYVDAPDRFDNRHLAKLPSPAAMKEIGVAHVLYVAPPAADLCESDDLNDDFVGWREAGIDVRILPTGDLVPSEATPPDTPPETRSAAPPESRPTHRTTRIHRHYWWGSSPHTHFGFRPHYGWGPSPTWVTPRPPYGLSNGARFTPSPRHTPYSTGMPGGNVHAVRPSPPGFGRTRFSPASGGGSSSPRSGTSNRTTSPSSSFGG